MQIKGIFFEPKFVYSEKMLYLCSRNKGYWVKVIGYWVKVIGYWVKVIGYW